MKTISFVIFFLLLLFIPKFIGDFYLQFLTKALILSIFTLSLNILVGYAGLVSLGHAMFFGLSGYFFALLFPQYEATNFFVGLFFSIIFTTFFSIVIGSLVVRTRNIYFIMSTLAFSQMFYYIFHDAEFSGGSDGIFIYERPILDFFGYLKINLDNIQNFYFTVLIFFLLAIFAIYFAMNSYYGNILMGVKENEKRMQSVGYNTYSIKLVAFVFSGFLASIAGFLSAIQYGVVNPEMLGWHYSGTALMMVIFGGVGTLIGPVLGTFTFLIFELIFQSFTKHWLLIMGFFIIVVALYFPMGIYGFVKNKIRIFS